jgi:hypothetical protein
MKILVTESQYKKLFKEEKEQKVLHIPSLKIFDENILVAWNNLQKFLEKKGNPPYSIGGNLDLRKTQIKSLGNLISVGGDLYLGDTKIKSLRNLESVGGNLFLQFTPIESLENLKSVGGNVFLRETPLSKMYTEKQIRKMVNVDGEIYF